MVQNNWTLRLTLALLSLLSVQGCAAQSSYGSDWWKSAGVDERTQFIAGYVDCETYDRQNGDFAPVQWTLVEPRISTYYSRHAETRRTAPSLILEMSGESAMPNIGGEVYPGKHGIFDGDYWRQMTPSGRTGFVEGYLSCRSSAPERLPIPKNPIAWYVRAIDASYCNNDQDCPDEHATEKIGDILSKLSGL